MSKLLGRKAGSTSYEYSSAIKNSGVVWTKQALFLYLKTPSQYISGNKMSFGGMPSEDDRANIIAYFED